MFAAITGPSLYRQYFYPERKLNIAETIGSTALSFARGIFYVTTSPVFGPIIGAYMYSRGGFNQNTMLFLVKYSCMLLIFGYMGRFIGRVMDPSYRNFIDIYTKAVTSKRTEDINLLKHYDFQLSRVPPDFEAVHNKDLWYLPAVPNEGNTLTRLVASWAVLAFGRHMLYPGSLRLFNYMFGPTLQNARYLMVTQRSGKRAWLKTIKGDIIDAMYIPAPDGTLEERKKTLVITCEGNAGFYEIGIANTPAQLGYNVLGWNHPGFAESSGLPYPENTLAAADAVMQYAIKVLGYKQEDIVLFGWSIGGFPAAWLAANYPNVKGLILDATFDDVVHLAESRMPKFLAPVVKIAIRENFNLSISKLAARYRGPLKLIRRLHEDIIVTDEGGSEEDKRASNRINYFLLEVLKERCPELVKDKEAQVDAWLRMRPEDRIVAVGPTSQNKALFEACDHFFVDFDGTHVSPLDPGYFNIPTAYRLRQ